MQLGKGVYPCALNRNYLYFCFFWRAGVAGGFLTVFACLENMQRMDFCTTSGNHPNPLHTNGYHRMPQTAVNTFGEGDHGGRKRSYPGCMSNGNTTYLKGSTEVEGMKVGDWVLPEKAAKVFITA